MVVCVCDLMFETCTTKNVFRVKEMRRKLLYVLSMIAYYPYWFSASGSGSRYRFL